MIALSSLSQPARAQFSASYKFLESVRKQEGQEVTDALNVPGTTIINTRDSATGDTALHIVVARRDTGWLTFLLYRGADPNIANNHGVTPLMLATSLGFEDGVAQLVKHGARLNDSDSAGETPLITAVHRHDIEMMRELLKAGADPDRTDNSGRSARDYAKLGGPDNPVINEIKQDAKARSSTGTGETYGPKL